MKTITPVASKNLLKWFLPLLLVLSYLNVKAQFQESVNDTNYYQILSRYQNLQPDSSEGSLYSQFQIWKRFWGPRLYPSGNFNMAARAYADYAQNENANKVASQITSTWTSLGPTQRAPIPNHMGKYLEMGKVDAIAIDPDNGNNIWVGSPYGGVFYSSDHGQTWSNYYTDDNTNLPFKGISDIELVKDANGVKYLFVATGCKDDWATYSIGVYRIKIGTQHWENISGELFAGNNNYPSKNIISKIVVNPLNTNIMYLGTKTGIYKTSNPFAQVPTDVHWIFHYISGWYIRGLALDPEDTGHIYASGHEVWESNDGGDTWNSISTGGFNSYPGLNEEPLRINIASTDISSTQQYLYAYVVTTFDTTITQNNSPANTTAHRLYIRRYSPGNGWRELYHKIYIFNDPPTYTGVDDIEPTRLAIAVSPDNPNMVFWGYTNFARTVYSPSSNTASTYIFGYDTYDIHPDVHAFLSCPNNTGGHNLYVGTDGGLSEINNPTDIYNYNISNLDGTGLSISAIWNISCAPNDPNMTLIGQLDDGSEEYKDPHESSSSAWEYVYPGDGGTQLAVSGDQYVTCTPYGHSEYKWWNGSNYSLNYTTDPQSCGAWHQAWGPFPIQYNPGTGHLYYGLNEMMENYDPENSSYGTNSSCIGWNKLSDFSSIFPGCYVDFLAFAIAPSNPNTIYGYVERYNCNGIPGNYSYYFYKTISGQSPSASYTPIPSSSYSTLCGRITSIAVDPENENKLWISGSGFEDNTLGQHSHIMYSSTGGQSWSDFSTGLPNLPVNKIIYEKGTNDQLYAATDAGVYVRNANMSSWQKYGDLPNVIVGDIDINYCSQKLRAGTYGRGLWETGLYKGGASIPQTQTLQADATWNTPHNITDDLIIPTGKKLIIDGTTVYVASEHKIIVQRGAILELKNNGTITNYCNGMLWNGIELQGNSAASQDDKTQQGQVIVDKTGGTIKNALNGITTIKTNPNGSWDWNYTGGIIEADNAKFINNWRAIQFLYYHNFDSNNGNTKPNESYFTDCHFETTRPLYGTGNYPNAFVTMYEVHGIYFQGNVFENTDLNDFADVTKRGSGIESIDASYTVNDGCNIENYGTQQCADLNDFKNLYHGITAMDGNPMNTIKVDGTHFDNVFRCVRMEGVAFATITNNIFKITEGLNTPKPFYSYGLYVREGSGYTIEGNKFSAYSAPTWVYGTIMDKTDQLAGEVFRNTYNNVTIGTQAQDANTYLQIKCNQYQNTSEIDIALPDPISTICDPQGSCQFLSQDPTTPANNVFSNNCTNNPEGDIYVDPNGEHFNYYHLQDNNGAGLKFIPSCKSVNVTVPPSCVTTTNGNQHYTYSQACPPPPNTTPGNTWSNVQLLSIQIQTLQNKIDGGNTAALMNSIATQPVGHVKNDLMAASPYLSDKALLAAVKRPQQLPPGILKDVLIPNSPLTDTVKQAVISIHLPKGIQKQIDAAQVGISARKELYDDIAYYKEQRSLQINSVIRYYLNDTTDANTIDSVKAILTADSLNPESKCMLLATQVKTADYSAAQSTITEMQASSSSGKLDNFCQLQRILMELQQQPDNCYAMKSDTVLRDKAEAISRDSTTFGCVNAKALLDQVFNKNFPEYIIPLPVGSSTQRLSGTPPTESTPGSGFKLYPNPASGNLSMQYQLPNGANNGTVRVYNDIGKQIAQFQLNSAQGVSTESIANWPNGLYFFSLEVNNNIVSSKKLVILH